MLPLQASKQNAPSNKSYFLFILVAIVAIGSGLLVQSSKAPPAKLPEFKKTILLPNTKPLISTEFTDHRGQRFGDEQFKGKWSILFFGFTNCPDVCPTTMHTLKQVKAELQQANVWHNYQVVMVSVDPERDTTERLASYVPFFDPEFIGVSAPLEATESFSKNVGILFFKSDETVNGGYDVDHGAAIILVNPEGQYAGVITAPHVKSTITADLIALSEYAGIKKTNAETVSSTANSMNTKNQSEMTQEMPASSLPALSFDHAWIRPAPPSANSMAAYFELRNNSDHDIIIEESESEAFEVSMIHNTIVEDGIASMQHMDLLLIPAKSTVVLEPLGMHMMLIQPKQELTIGDHAEIIFTDQDGQEHSVSISVRPQPEK